VDERDGVVGLALVAALAWLLPAAVRAFDAQPAAQFVIAAQVDPGAHDGFRYRWASPPRTPAAPDGWVVATDGSPLTPAPGWRGLLLGHPLDLNTATATDLEALPGIGPHTAAAVLADRCSAGPFTTVEELVRVRGIGATTLDRLRPSLRVTQALPTDGRVPRSTGCASAVQPRTGESSRAQDAQERPGGVR